jgi:hypothetical protein
MPFFERLHDRRLTHLEHTGNIAYATSIAGHIDELLCYRRQASLITVVDDEGMTRPIGILTTIALLPLSSDAMFHHICCVTMRTAHKHNGHHDLR